MIDVLDLVKDKEIKCLDKGLVRLVDCLPRLIPEGQTADYAIVQAARVSYGEGTKSISEDRGLIRYLMRHKHTSPIEQCELKFHIKAPLYVFAQNNRHRTASLNQESARYSVMKDEFHIFKPEEIRNQSTTNKQSSEGQYDPAAAEDFCWIQEQTAKDLYEEYDEALKKGVPREQARTILPVNLYSQMYWKIDLHNLLHYLSLRMDSHAQKEIRVYAEAMYEIVKQIFPITIEAFDDYHELRGGMKLTRLEIEALRYVMKENKAVFLPLESDNKREQAEWEAKWNRIVSGD